MARKGKRKAHSSAVIDRPTKQMRTDTEEEEVVLMEENGPIPTGALLELMEDSSETGPLLPLPAAARDTLEWQATIEKVILTVVQIRFCQTCTFDTDPAGASEATGFVVDAERGYILTNRHVVGAGPFWGYCIFDNHEECDVHPVYRDPVHDFGFLRFDPKAIKYMPVTSLELQPEHARVGVEIRVVGNDAGEKLSILSGVISRLDRNAPEYGEGYCDFNTNYIQAAAAASGGSSGSPVVNIDGYAVALQAGGRSDGAATDYFLPLNRPARSLECLRKAEPVTRGTIQVSWTLKAFDECRRLGLSSETEAIIRQTMPKETSILAADIILPEGPADGKIEPGDVLIRVNGELLTQFIRLEEILDAHVGDKVTLTVQRNGEDVEVELMVGDLHVITPDRFVTVSGGSFHNLSYQQARACVLPVKGVYMCEAGSSFRLDGSGGGCIILSVDQKETPTLDAFVDVVKAIPDRARIIVTWRQLDDVHSVHTSFVHLDRHWVNRMRMAVRNDETGVWDYTDFADAPPPVPPVPQRANFIQLNSGKYGAAADLIRSFVRVTCVIPVQIDGFPRPQKTGYGLVVDAERGLVVVSRAIVPFDLCDITVTVADSIQVDGRVQFLHPLQNYAIISYDPSLVLAPVQSARLSQEMIKLGADTIFIGFNQNLRVTAANTTVTDITTVTIPASSIAPRYRAINVDAITVDTSLAPQCGSGVLVAQDGTVEALWLTYTGDRHPSTRREMDYHLALATPTLLPVIEQLQKGKTTKPRILSMEFQVIQMSQARVLGVSENWLQKVEADNAERHQLFMVHKLFCGHEHPLQERDVLLSLNGKTITRVSDLDVMYDHEVLDTVIIREGKEMQLDVPTASTADLETDHVVIFCGALLHRPHFAVRQQVGKIHSEVYVSGRTRGSPAYQYNLVQTSFILAVNGVATTDLPSFVKEVVEIPDNTYFRLKVISYDNVPFVVTMKKNDHYFPLLEFIRDPNEPMGWKRQTYENGRLSTGVTLLPEAMDTGTPMGSTEQME